MQVAAALSGADRYDTAFDEVLDDLREELGGVAPTMLAAFVGSAHEQHYVRLHHMLREAFPDATLVGCSAGGTVGSGRELEEGAGFAVTAAALPGVHTKSFHIESDRVPKAEAADLWQQSVGLPEDAEEPSFIVLPDPFTGLGRHVVRGLDQNFEGSTVIGGLASGMQEAGEGALFADGDVHASGTVGLALWGNVRLEPVVAQGCRPIGTPMFVTRGHDNVIAEIDGQSPARVLQDLYEQLSDDDQSKLRHSLFVGMVMQDRQQVYGHGDFLIRNIVGLDGDTGALAIGADVQPNTVIQFHLRDAETSAADLRTLLTQSAGQHETPPAGAFMFSCLGRGQGLYGTPDHDVGLVRSVFDDLPVGGFFCNGEIGPVQSTTHLHGYTTVLGLLRRR